VRRYAGVEALSPEELRAPVCTIGVFDGVHLGHQRLLGELRAWAGEVGGEACVLTFEVHPANVLRGIEIPLVMGLEQRLLELERQGIEAAVVLDFTAIRNLSPADFLRSIVLEKLGCRRFLLGFDSRVGRGGAGDVRTLPDTGREVGVEVRIGEPLRDDGGRKVGSSALRAAVGRGDLGGAARLLGRPMSLAGRIVRGAGRGASLGTSTANLEVENGILPPDGVYLVRVRSGDEEAPGVANLGVRPTFGAGSRTFEVHVPGWTGERYGEFVEADLVRRLRDERRFQGPADLRRQIAADLEALHRAVAAGEI
jgi:riboflavin kinase/FMN adenylyltransferase